MGKRPSHENLEEVVRQLEKESLERERAEKALRENVRRLQVAYEQSIVYARQLNEQIAERKRVEAALRKSEAAVKEQVDNLEEVNTALKVLLKRREEDKAELEEKVLSNVKGLVLPYVDALRNTRLDPKQQTYLGIIESHLNSIVSPFSAKLSAKYWGLTPREIQIAALIKEGKTSKEIAELSNVSTRAIEFHRDNIRAKLGLKNKKANLRSSLLSLP
ncbi:MAG: LuxR C-terminal-related transcriptional regulator [Thermodesulfobacteriota bacterium]|nr:LuxR C-terminal-related transcriptional regulator [Thermodesulfobacteriota bacterium]